MTDARGLPEAKNIEVAEPSDLATFGDPVSRRTLLRAGATAAFAAPVIMMASAVPAAAASGPAAFSKASAETWSATSSVKNGTTTWVETATITVNNTGGTAGFPTLTFVFTPTFAANELQSITVSGWTALDNPAKTSHHWTTSAAIAGPGSLTATFTVTYKKATRVTISTSVS